MSIDLVRAPQGDDNKYSRGVLGFLTGSAEFPGAAILGVSAAIRTGVGMVRYLGPASVAELALAVRPEIVTQPGAVDAWVLGSGVASSSAKQLEKIANLLDQKPKEPMVIDAEALTLDQCKDLRGQNVIITPHLGEAKKLAKAISADFDVEHAQAPELAAFLARHTSATVLLKGHQTLLADGRGVEAQPIATTALATAGTGDVLAGILGAICAINSAEILSGSVSMFEVAKAGVAVHSMAAEIASAGAPIAALDVADAVGQAIARLRGK